MSKKLIDLAYRIAPSSSIEVTGLTNFDSFTCKCSQIFSLQKCTIEVPDQEERSTLFHATLLQIPIKSLDCGNPIMNHQLQRSLNADQFPNISIELRKAAWEKNGRPWESDAGGKIQALVQVSLNGQNHDYWLEISGRKTGNLRYHCSGEKTLRMTDFEIKPPTAMMGLVKVKDEIKICLDLEISLLPNVSG